MVNNKSNISLWKGVLENCPESYKKLFAAEKELLERRYINMDSKVLDVGCGDGRSIEDICKYGAWIYGIDNDWDTVTEARKRFLDLPRVSVLIADGKDAPFKDSFFDYVISMTTPANFGDDKYEIYSEMRRVLKDDGDLIISVFNEGALSDRLEVYGECDCDMRDVRDDGTVVFAGEYGEIVSEQFSMGELEGIFNKSGFRVEEITRAGVGYVCRARKA